LIHHERVVHSSYNLPQIGIAILPQEAINEFKDILVYNIQKNYQIIYITQHLITKHSYECSFSGQDAYNILYQILGDENWGIRHYSLDQQTAVILVVPPTTNLYESETNNINSQKRYKNFSNFEFSVQ
ncbi:30683_t:CDS:2, partial [Gigaspora margarita]